MLKTFEIYKLKKFGQWQNGESMLFNTTISQVNGNFDVWQVFYGVQKNRFKNYIYLFLNKNLSIHLKIHKNVRNI